MKRRVACDHGAAVGPRLDVSRAQGPGVASLSRLLGLEARLPASGLVTSVRVQDAVYFLFSGVRYIK